MIGLIQEETEMNKLELDIPEGYEIDLTSTDLVVGIIRLKKVNGLPTSWDSLKEISGYYVDSDSDICFYKTNPLASEDRNTFRTKKQAEASVAFAEITQLLDKYPSTKNINWGDGEVKYVIEFYSGSIVKDNYYNSCHFLAFTVIEERDHFFAEHKVLIKKAAPLLWGVEL